jgi:hypothetical protein
MVDSRERAHETRLKRLALSVAVLMRQHREPGIPHLGVASRGAPT